MEGFSSSEYPPFVYRIDKEDVLIFVNDAWADFAKKNGTPSLANKVVGTRLWDHLCGREVIRLYATLLKQVRRDGRRRTFPFRCDSPTLRRDMIMILELLPNEEVEFRCELVRAVAQEPICLPNGKPQDTERLIKMCSWCLRVKADTWMDLADAANALSLFEEATTPAITHGVCEECKTRILADLRGHR